MEHASYNPLIEVTATTEVVRMAHKVRWEVKKSISDWLKGKFHLKESTPLMTEEENFRDILVSDKNRAQRILNVKGGLPYFPDIYVG